MLGRSGRRDMEARLSGSWTASMQTALAATLARPAWWVMALAGFLIRGGLLVVLLALVSLPSVPSLATALAPPIEALVLSRQSIEGALLATVLVATLIGLLAAAGLAGAWLDLALLREANEGDELDLHPTQPRSSAWLAFGVRVAAHLPTFLAVGYATVRIVVVTYQELLSPGDPTIPVAARVVARAPDAIVLVFVFWLLGEAVGGLAARRAVAGQTVTRALLGALRDLLERRGLATFVLTSGVVLSVIALLVAVVGPTSGHLTAYLLDRADAITIAAALLLLVSTWILGLAALGAALAWRATAWTIEARVSGSGAQSLAPALEEAQIT
jgi:hypothetical protein